MPYNENKPCMYVVGKFEDLRKRLYHINLLEKITDAFVSSTLKQYFTHHFFIYLFIFFFLGGGGIF